MNAKTMAAILEHMDAKSERICMLDEKLRNADEMFRKWKNFLGLNAKLTSPEIEAALKRMSLERTTLETNYKQHVELVSALATCPLPRDSAESNTAYALRVGEALKDAKKQWEHDQRRIAQLEKRESELNALHDTIEAVPGFPMQPEETYAEYLQRLSADRAFHADESSRRFADIEHLKASSAQTLERLRSQLDQNNEQYAEERAKNQLLTEKHNDLHATNDELRKQRDAWMDGKYLVHFEPGLHGLSWAVVDNGVVTEFSPLAAGDNMRGISAPRPEIGLWFTRVVHQPRPGQHEMVDVEMPIIIRAIENADAAKSATDMQAECVKLAAEREHFRAKWDASLKARDLAQDEARRTRDSNEALQGQLTLRSQIIARVMMDPATDKLFNERDWSDAARKVLIDARALCGDTSEANVTTKEPQ